VTTREFLQSRHQVEMAAAISLDEPFDTGYAVQVVSFTRSQIQMLLAGVLFIGGAVDEYALLIGREEALRVEEVKEG
jgi:hypothetical protein